MIIHETKLLKYKIFSKINLKAYTSVGCFGTSCAHDSFNELVDSTTCYSMAAITGASCYSACPESRYFLGSSSMTIELCLQACTSQGFSFASINMFYF
jgi:hypothetical protein